MVLAVAVLLLRGVEALVQAFSSSSVCSSCLLFFLLRVCLSSWLFFPSLSSFFFSFLHPPLLSPVFLFVSVSLSLSLPVGVSLVFLVSIVSVSSLHPFPSKKLLFLPFGLSLFSKRKIIAISLLVPPLFSCFSSPLPFIWVVFIGAGGAGSTLPRPSPPVHGAHFASSATAPAVVANGGVACEARLLEHLIMRWVASDLGSKARGRKRQGEENKTSLTLLSVRRKKKKKKQCRLKTTPFRLFFSLSVFFNTHKTMSFCLKRAVSFK